MTTDTDTARSQARAQLDTLVEMVEALNDDLVWRKLFLLEEWEEMDAAEAIQEDPLEVSVRGSWQSPGIEPEFTEYQIILCTGGPAVRITGDLDNYGQPADAKLEYQDWFTPWETYHDVSEDEQAALDTYVAQFYFGD